MKKLTILYLCLLSHLVGAGGTVHVLYGSLKGGQQQILNRVFRSKLSRLKEYPQVERIVEVMQASTSDLTAALRNKNAVGVIFLGHPAIKTKGKLTNKRIIHGYLQDAQGRYLPKEILSSAHQNLKFLSIMTCHESAILPLYLSKLPFSTTYYKSPTHGLNGLDNPLYEFTSFYSTPKILDDIVRDLKNQKHQFSSFSERPTTKLKIKIRDLVSQRFGYSVLVNDKFIGSLFSQSNNRGRLLNRSEFVFEVEKSSLEANNLTIKVIPDDASRPRPFGLKVVDDILIDSITLGRNEVLGDTIHIGDQADEPDLGEGLGFLRNRDAFREAPFQEMLEIRL